MAILLLLPYLNSVEILVVIQEHSDTSNSLPCTGSWKYMPPLQLWKAETAATARSYPSQPPLPHHLHVSHVSLFRCKQRSREVNPQKWAMFVLVTYLHKSGEKQSRPRGGNLCFVNNMEFKSSIPVLASLLLDFLLSCKSWSAPRKNALGSGCQDWCASW